MTAYIAACARYRCRRGCSPSEDQGREGGEQLRTHARLPSASRSSGGHAVELRTCSRRPEKPRASLSPFARRSRLCSAPARPSRPPRRSPSSAMSNATLFVDAAEKQTVEQCASRSRLASQRSRALSFPSSRRHQGCVLPRPSSRQLQTGSYTAHIDHPATEYDERTAQPVVSDEYKRLSNKLSSVVRARSSTFSHCTSTHSLIELAGNSV